MDRTEKLKKFFGLIVFLAVAGMAMWFVIFIFNQARAEINHQYRALLITEKGSFRADFEERGDCLLIKETSKSWRPYLYCGKYVIENENDN